MFKKSVKIWQKSLSIMLVFVAISLIISAITQSDTIEYLAGNAIVLAVLGLLICVGVRETKVVRGLSKEGYFIIETLEGVELKDFAGLNKADMQSGLHYLTQHKEAEGFRFTGANLFDIMMVRFKDDKKSGLVVDSVANTEQEILVGYVTLKSADSGLFLKVSGKQFKIADIEGTVERVSAVATDKLCCVTIARPIETAITNSKGGGKLKLLSKDTLQKWKIPPDVSTDSWGVLCNIEVVEG